MQQRQPLRSLPIEIGAPCNIPSLETNAFSKSGIHLQVASPGGNTYKVRPDEDGVVSSSFVKRYIHTHQQAELDEEEGPRPSVVERNSSRTFVSLARTITTRVVEKKTEPFAECQRFRLNTSTSRKGFAEFFVCYNIGVKRVGSSWRRFSDFKSLAKDIKRDGFNFPKAHKAWERVVSKQKWTRCLKESYLKQKKTSLDAFVTAIIEDSVTHRKGFGILQKFVCDFEAGKPRGAGARSPAPSMHALNRSGNF
jgi:hypothetical protein